MMETMRHHGPIHVREILPFRWLVTALNTTIFFLVGSIAGVAVINYVGSRALVSLLTLLFGAPA